MQKACVYILQFHVWNRTRSTHIELANCQKEILRLHWRMSLALQKRRVPEEEACIQLELMLRSLDAWKGMQAHVNDLHVAMQSHGLDSVNWSFLAKVSEALKIPSTAASFWEWELEFLKALP